MVSKLTMRNASTIRLLSGLVVDSRVAVLPSETVAASHYESSFASWRLLSFYARPGFRCA